MNTKRLLSVWLVSTQILIVVMVMIGGITRLTQSGLSIVEWKLVTGSIPPLSQKQWTTAFESYQKTPEYKQINQGMSLAEFRWIYFWEYLHRLLGRLIGLVIVIPYLFFWVRAPEVRFKGAVAVGLVVLQGVAGWWMVKSGLVSNPHVSHYRLALHLGLAFLLFQWLFWMLLEQWVGRRQSPSPLRDFSWWVTGLIAVQIIYGAFVAGLDAGIGFNTWPKMGDQWIPSGMLINFFENHIAIQFIHRNLAVLVAFAVFLLWWMSRKHVILIAVLIQFSLGVATLLFIVPLPLALAHQLGALFLLTASVYLNYVL